MQDQVLQVLLDVCAAVHMPDFPCMHANQGFMQDQIIASHMFWFASHMFWWTR